MFPIKIDKKIQKKGSGFPKHIRPIVGTEKLVRLNAVKLVEQVLRIGRGRRLASEPIEHFATRIAGIGTPRGIA